MPCSKFLIQGEVISGTPASGIFLSFSFENKYIQPFSSAVIYLFVQLLGKLLPFLCEQCGNGLVKAGGGITSVCKLHPRCSKHCCCVSVQLWMCNEMNITRRHSKENQTLTIGAAGTTFI